MVELKSCADLRLLSEVASMVVECAQTVTDVLVLMGMLSWCSRRVGASDASGCKILFHGHHWPNSTDSECF